MPLPVKNTCTPASIFGGFQQTIFLGCSVASFSASSGWNEQKAEVTVQLVQDPCDGNKVYWDRSLEQQSWTGPDPGFIGEETPIIGAPVYFRVGDFEFSGIIADWSKADVRSLTTGLPVESWGENVNAYTIKLEDPREILAGTQVIINEYAGFTTGLDNIINAYGFMEATSANCPLVTQGIDGAIFGSPAAGFGGADVDPNGMPWNNILAGLRVLVSGTSTFGALGGAFSPGYLAFKGISNTGYTGVSGITSGMGLIDSNAFREAWYAVDLTELPVLPTTVRFNGTSIGLMDLVSQVCEISGHDYYIELLPVDAGAFSPTVGGIVDTQNIVKILKIRVSDRDSQPLFGAIEEFIDIQADANGTMRNQVGRELRNEITQQLVVGGQKQNIFDTTTVSFEDPEGDGAPANPQADDMIVPYFGLDSDGNAIIPEKDGDGNWFFEADCQDLNVQLAEYGHAFGVGSVTINELELRHAMAGMELWMIHSQKANTDINGEFNFENVFKVANMEKALDAAAGGDDVAARDLKAIGNSLWKLGTDDEKSRTAADVIYNWVKKFATDFYGTKFMVRVPNTCAYVPSTYVSTFVGWGGQIITSEQPSDGGWTEKNPIVGLVNPDATTDFFRHEDGRLMNILRFPDVDESDISDLNPDEYLVNTTTNILWHKSNSEPEYVYIDKATRFSPRVVMEISAPIPCETDQGDPNNKIQGLREALNVNGDAARAAKALAAMKNVGGADLIMPFENCRKIPNAAAVAIKSNALRYGPYASSTVAGKASVKTEEGLVPWEYGSYATMNTAGSDLSAEGVTFMQVGESGSVTIPGYPTVPLGAELLSASAANSFAAAGPFNGGGNNLFENRTLTATITGPGTYVSTTVVAFASGWNGTYGPNVTGVNVVVGPDGINTTYNMRTYTPKFGRFARYNAERLKQVGQNAMRAAKTLRAFQLQRFKSVAASKLDAAIKGARKARANQGPDAKAKGELGATPHEMLVGQYLPWNEGAYKRSIVADEPLNQFFVESENYHCKAFMSWDGLIMPVSMDGDGNLPRYAIPTTGCTKGNTKAAIPPIDKEGEAGDLAQYNLDINIDYLNPFSNPDGLSRSETPVDRSDTPDIGHHVDIIGREGESGNVPPASSMVMPIQGLIDSDDKAESDYKDDYRMFALRGPLLLHGWGYDTEGYPIPNKVDNEADTSGGVFETGSLECKFMDDWLRKPHSWPVAPVDLRYDRERAVWVSPPQYMTVCGRLKEDLAPSGSALAEIVDGPDLVDCSGTAFTGEFYVHDCIGVCLTSGDSFQAEYDSRDCKYKMINQKGGDKLRFVEICSCMGYNQTGLARNTIWDETEKRFVGSGDCFTLYPGLLTEHGPFQSGWFALVTDADVPPGDEAPGHSGKSGVLPYIVTANKKHEFIEFCVSGDFGSADFAVSGNEDITANVAVSYGWDGIGETSDSHVIQLTNMYAAQCLKSGDCGVAILDEVATSAVQGNDPVDCTKWVYNVVSFNDTIAMSNSGCSGLDEYSPQAPSGTGYPREIVWGTGLRITENPDETGQCKFVVNTMHCAADTNECYDFENEGRLSIINPMECLVLGAGLMATTGTTFGERACDIFVNAGFVTTNNEACVKTTGTLRDENYDRVVNRINWQRGMHAWDNENSLCTINVGAGFTVSGTQDCCEDAVNGPVDNNTLFSAIKTCSGISVSKDSADECAIKLGLNLKVTDGTNERIPVHTIQFNAESGFMVKDGGDDCVAEIGWCTQILNESTCLTDTNTGCWSKGIKAMGGIRGNYNNGFAELGLDLTVAKSATAVNPVTRIEVGDGLTVSDQGGCVAQIEVCLGDGLEFDENGCITCDCSGTGTGVPDVCAGKGISLDDDDCIELDFSVNGLNPIVTLNFDQDCFEVTDGGNCVADISLSMSATKDEECIESHSDDGNGFCTVVGKKGIMTKIDGGELQLGLDLALGDFGEHCDDYQGSEIKPVAKIEYGSGIRAEEGDEDCEAKVMLHLPVSNDDTCFASQNVSGPIRGIAFSTGLATAWEQGEEGCLKLGTNFTVSDEKTQTVKSGVHHIQFGSGLRAQNHAQDTCGVYADLCFITTCATGCMTEPNCTPQLTYGLRFGRGLWVDNANAPSGYADVMLNYQLFNETGNNLIEPTTRLNVGSGLRAWSGREHGGDSTSCEGYLALDFLSTRVNGCWNDQDTDVHKIFGIRWGSGIYNRHTSPSDNGSDRKVVDIVAGLKFTDGSNNYEPINRVYVTGLSVTPGNPNGGDEDCAITLDGSLCVKSVTGCFDKDFDPGSECYKTRDLRLGSGLYPNSGTAEGRLDLIAGLYCEWYDSDDTADSGEPITAIKFGSGLIGEQNENCELEIDWSGCVNIHTDCLEQESCITDVSCYSELHFGSGFRVVDDGDGVVKLDTQITVDNVRQDAATQNFVGKRHFRFMEGIVASGNTDCEIDIDINLDVLHDDASQVERVLDINFTSGLLAADGGDRKANVGLPQLLTAGSATMTRDGGGTVQIQWDQYGRLTSVTETP